MKHNLSSQHRRGMATVEWIILAIVFGLSLVVGALLLRNTLIDEYGHLIEAIKQVDIGDCATCGPIFPP